MKNNYIMHATILCMSIICTSHASQQPLTLEQKIQLSNPTYQFSGADRLDLKNICIPELISNTFQNELNNFQEIQNLNQVKLAINDRLTSFIMGLVNITYLPEYEQARRQHIHNILSSISLVQNEFTFSKAQPLDKALEEVDNIRFFIIPRIAATGHADPNIRPLLKLYKNTLKKLKKVVQPKQYTIHQNHYHVLGDLTKTEVLVPLGCLAGLVALFYVILNACK